MIMIAKTPSNSDRGLVDLFDSFNFGLLDALI